MPLLWDGGKQALKTGTGLDWMPPAVQSQTPVCGGALTVTLLYCNCIGPFHLTIYCLSHCVCCAAALYFVLVNECCH